MDTTKDISNQNGDTPSVSEKCLLNEQKDTIPIDESVLYNVLYGIWPEWGGHRPPEYVRQKLLRSLPSGLLQSIPKELYFDVSTLPYEGLGIFAASLIAENTIIGPVWESNGNASVNTTATITHRDLGKSRLENLWIKHIRFARNYQEQNTETTSMRGAIYYRTLKDIQPGYELLVWMGKHIIQQLGLPLDNSIEKKEHFPSIEYPDDGYKKRLFCVICQRGFNSRSNLRSHMRTHTMQKPFKCSFCFRKFSQSSTLRNHTRLHTGEKPYKCKSCNSSYSQLAGLRAHQKSSHHSSKNNV